MNIFNEHAITHLSVQLHNSKCKPHVITHLFVVMQLQSFRQHQPAELNNATAYTT